MAGNGTTKLQDVIARPDLWFYPGEELDPDEMRVTLMGTGWGNIIRPNQKGASVFVELGNGDSFVFDAGPGCGINYNVMQVPASRMTKVFLTHLHMDHTSDLAWMYAFGPAGDRYTPLQVWGPSGDKPEYGTKANIEGIKVLTQWHRPSFAACLDVGQSYDLEITEFDYRRNPGIAYQGNGVTITRFPRLHIIDGAVGYRLEWSGLSVVWTGDGQPELHHLGQRQRRRLVHLRDRTNDGALCPGYRPAARCGEERSREFPYAGEGAGQDVPAGRPETRRDLPRAGRPRGAPGVLQRRSQPLGRSLHRR